MKKSAAILFMLLAIIHVVSAQNNVYQGGAVETIKINATVLDEEREIQIYLPASYHQEQQKYPVLYVIDGQRYFLNGIAFQQNLTWREIAPKFIIVGIITDGQRRRKLFHRESAAFIQFLEKELIPKIDREYRTLDERIYFGWEMAAGLGVEVMADKPTLFDAFLLASPTHITKERLKRVEERLKNPESKIMAFGSLGKVENWAIGSMNQLDSLFRQHTSKNIRWKYILGEEENHYTTPLLTINKGLSMCFDDYGPLRFYSLKAFEDFGGIEALKAHYEKRGARYQISTAIHNDTKHYLLLQAHKENNFELFEELIATFDGIPFIASYYRFPRWFNRFAGYCMENNQMEYAYEILDRGLKKFPESSMLQNEMGNYFREKGKIKQAKSWYKKAIATAKKNAEETLDEYVKNLEAL